MTSDACHKGLPKSPTGEIPQFKGMSPPCHGQALAWGHACASLSRVHFLHGKVL